MILHAFFTLFFCMVSPLAATTLTWMSDFQKALEVGKKEEKPLLVFFTGSDWSGWSMKMKKEILDAPDFIEKIKGQFVCVEVDFPQHRILSKEAQSQNLTLKDRYEVTEYPRLIILDPSEREIARLGYSPETGEKFAKDLISIVEKDINLTKVMKQFSSTTFSSNDLKMLYIESQELHRLDDADRFLEAGLKSEDPLFFLLEKYRLLVEEGKGQENETTSLREELKKLDPINQRGTQFSLALIHFQELANQAERKASKEVIKPLEDYLAAYGEIDHENIWRVEMMIAQFYLDLDECSTALKHAEVAYQSAPLNKKKDIEQSLNYIRKQASFVVEAK